MRKTKKRVVVAMSGGVDSAVAAGLLKKDGFEVIGITMCFNIANANTKKPSCCGIQGIEDARRAAGILSIPHYVLNFGKVLTEKVVKNFCLEYLRGHTPNPCVRCNQYLKFDSLLNKTKEFDADYLATGHYAKIIYSKSKKRYLLKKATDKFKDQSYFLYGIKKESLPHILMPLGGYTKTKVRQIAKELKLNVADKPGSQEICFVDTNYRDFLKSRLPQFIDKKTIQNKIKPGPIIDTNGKILGEHNGIPFYTLGQREGLGVSLGHKAYVTKINPRTNTLTLGHDEDLYSDELTAEKVNLIALGEIKKPIACQAKIRYNHHQAKCVAYLGLKNNLKIKFEKPQRAITPGQSVVLYDKDIVLGGGIIE